MKSNGYETSVFRSISHGLLILPDVIKTIKLFLEEEPKSDYSLVIGSDSQEKSLNGTRIRTVQLVTAVVVHRKGFGGKYFWIKKQIPIMATLRQRIYSETLTSLEFATMFVPLLKKSLNGTALNYKLEIHVDVGEHGDTREMIREVVGMVTGNGFVAKTKPEAYGASYVADKHT